ncbi:MAG: hypothetical protein GKR99_01290 [Rhodobacteraceae bacterium]|nr:hypothetical protein [Paracoccaceae bacterium]
MIIKTIMLMSPLVLLSWIAVMAVVMVTTDAAPGAVVILPSQGLIGNLPDGAAILGHSPVSITLTSDAPGFGRALYAAGAWLVLPAGLTGCLPLPKAPVQA